MIPLVLAYKRPELTNRLVARLLEIDSEYKRMYGGGAFSSILLIHDGLRKTEDNESQGLHQRTRELCFDLERANTKIRSIAFNANLGLTQHLFRIVDELDSDLSNYISFEEDKAPTLQGIEFLDRLSKSMDSRALVDTLPLNKHKSRRNAQTSTLFTDNGNLMIGNEFYDLVKHLWSVKDKYQAEFEKNLHTYLSFFLSGFSLKRAYGYYSKFFSWGLTNVDRPDSLFNYALVLSKKFRICPFEPSTENWSNQDKNAMNVTTVPTNRNNECEYSTETIWGFEICTICENQGVSERVALNRIGALQVGLNFRLRKYLNSKQT